jgi:hypothetical protein
MSVTAVNLTSWLSTFTSVAPRRVERPKGCSRAEPDEALPLRQAFSDTY